MNTKEYNGWTNYETWLVKLWMDNSESSDAFYREKAQEVYAAAQPDDTFSKAQRATLDLGDALKEDYQEASCELLEGMGQGASVWSDLLGAALSEVNWHEIAEHMIDDCDKETEAA